MPHNEIEIALDAGPSHGATVVKLNGVELQYLTDVFISASVDEPTRVTVTMLANVNYKPRRAIPPKEAVVRYNDSAPFITVE